MKSLRILFTVVGITTFINSAASKINIKIHQLLHWFSRFIFNLPILIIEAHRNFSVYIETITVKYGINSTANIYSATHPGTLSVHSEHISVMSDSYRPSSKLVSQRSGNIFEAPAFRRTYIDAMSRVLRYAGLAE